MEVQDEGSQLAAFLADAQPGQRVIDFCAGAGGKTLAIAAQMKNKGKILAFDVSEKRLTQMKPRLKRAGVDNVEIHVLSSESDSYLKRHKGTADRVFIDAPCSGSGTWRRNPDLKWRLTQTQLDELSEIQRRILDSAARLVKKGGRLIYVTCSMLQCENEQQLSGFLDRHPHFRVVKPEEIWNKDERFFETQKIARLSDRDYFRTTPHQDGTDGFFAAILESIGDVAQ